MIRPWFRENRKCVYRRETLIHFSSLIVDQTKEGEQHCSSRFSISVSLINTEEAIVCERVSKSLSTMNSWVERGLHVRKSKEKHFRSWSHHQSFILKRDFSVCVLKQQNWRRMKVKGLRSVPKRLQNICSWQEETVFFSNRNEEWSSWYLVLNEISYLKLYHTKFYHTSSFIIPQPMTLNGMPVNFSSFIKKTIRQNNELLERWVHSFLKHDHFLRQTELLWLLLRCVSSFIIIIIILIFHQTIKGWSPSLVNHTNAISLRESTPTDS